MIQCPYCLEVRPWSGSSNIFRHIAFEAHPDSERGRAILMVLSREPLPRSWTPRSPSSTEVSARTEGPV